MSRSGYLVAAKQGSLLGQENGWGQGCLGASATTIFELVVRGHVPSPVGGDVFQALYGQHAISVAWVVCEVG